MNLQLNVQPIQVYSSENTSLVTLLEQSRHTSPFYGLVVGRFGKIEGYFSNAELLQYCLHVGLDFVDDIDHLRGFKSYLRRSFTLLSSIPKEPIELNDTDLLIIKKDHQYIGCIDRENYLNALTKVQQHSLRHYETIFQAMPNGVIAVDIEGHITMINKAGVKISGVPYEKAINRFITDVVPPKGLLEVLQSGQGQTEKYKVRKRWYVSYREPIYDGMQLVGAVGVFDDISRMESLTSELDTYRQLLRENELLLNTSSLGIAIMQHNNTVIRQNERFKQHYISIMYDDYNREQFRKTFEHALKKQQEKTLTIQNKQGQVLHCRFTPIENLNLKTPDRIIVQIEDNSATFEQHHRMQNLQNNIQHIFSLRHTESVPISAAFEERLAHISKVNTPILLLGAQGTGRSVTAKQIIHYSERNCMPFITIDCAQQTAKQLELMLFGIYEVPPIFALATGGTLYIKNIDYLPLELQKKLVPALKALTNLNIRLITSMSENSIINIFEPLYYTINAITLDHPPLKDRHEQAKQVIVMMLQHLCAKHNRKITLSEESLDFLVYNEWLCNFQTIKTLLEHLCLHSPSDVWHPTHFLQEAAKITNKPITVNSIFPLKDAVNEVEKEMLSLLMKKNLSYRQMAKILDVNPSTIVRKIKKLKV